ncbi:MAG: DUF2252 family protein [Myxococcales bacterium]|nr:DUF2252 family protein [Myxococcales bacterium]
MRHATPRQRLRYSLPALISALLVTAGLSTAKLGCAQAIDDPRAVWLHDTLVEDNRDLLERDPEAVAEKFAKMQSSLYAYFRGTANQYWRDLTTPDLGIAGSSFATPETARISLIGDPHYENVGVFHSADDQILVDFNDFDASMYGPYWIDLRRLAVGMEILCRQLGDELISAEQRRAVVDAATQGYVEEMARLVDGQPAFSVSDGEGGAILADLTRRAVRDGEIAEELDDYTEIVDGRRLMRIGDIEPPGSGFVTDTVDPVAPSDQMRILTMVAAYAQTVSGNARENAFFTVKGVVRRRGAGVSSYPNLRYYVLIEGETSGVEDDRLLELKEVRDPPLVTADWNVPARRWTNNAERVVFMQRQLQETSANDPLLGWALSGSVSFRIRERTKYQKGLDVVRLAEKLEEGDWDSEDLIEVSFNLGRFLARAHGTTPDSDGRLGAPLIGASLGDLTDPVNHPLVLETSEFAVEYADRIEADFALFARLREDWGATLGFGELR